jgi:hypothetical protein
MAHKHIDGLLGCGGVRDSHLDQHACIGRRNRKRCAFARMPVLCHPSRHLQGWRGDTEVAHVTPGEIVIPRELQTPELMQALAEAAEAQGLDLASFQVGSGRNSINPKTGRPEFADGILLPEIEEIPITAIHRPLEDLGWHGEVGRRAQAVYGETAALRPQLINPAKSLDNPKNWQPDSTQALADARKELATMYGTVNDKMRPAVPPNPSNPIAEEQWRRSVSAATDSMNHTLDPRFTNMAMHQQGAGPQSIESWTDKQMLESRGPFINPLKPTEEQLQKGKAIGAGPRAYIDFYGKKPK